LQLLELGAGVQLEAGEEALDQVAVAGDEQLQALAGLGEGQVALGALEVDRRSKVSAGGAGRAAPGRREEQALEVEVAVGRAEAVVVAAGDAALDRAPGTGLCGDEAAAELELGEGVRGEFLWLMVSTGLLAAGWTTGRRRRWRRTGAVEGCVVGGGGQGRGRGGGVDLLAEVLGEGHEGVVGEGAGLDGEQLVAVVAVDQDLAGGDDLEAHAQEADEVQRVLGVVAELCLELGAPGVPVLLPALVGLPLLARAAVATLALEDVEEVGREVGGSRRPSAIMASTAPSWSREMRERSGRPKSARTGSRFGGFITHLRWVLMRPSCDMA
jgi:hypothetical protein